MSKERRELFRQLSDYSQIGMTVVFSIFIGLGIGWYLDYKVFHGKTSPYFTIIFFAFGILAGFKTLYDLYKKMMRE